MNLYSVLVDTATAHPGLPAVVAPEAEYTYADLVAWIENLASGFWRLGLKPGNRVVVLLRNRPAALAVFWACMALGTVAVPVNPDNSRQSLGDTLADVEPQAIIYEGVEGGRIRDFIGNQRPLLIGVETDDADIAIGEFPRLIRGPSGFRMHQPQDDEVALILYTTGTTGRPKGVPRTHGNTLAAAKAHAVQHHYNTSDRMLGMMPLSHTMGIHLYIATTLLGATYVLAPEMDPGQVSESIERQRITVLYQTPFFYYTLLHSGRSDTHDWSTVSKLSYAGAVMREDLIQDCIDRFRPTVFINHYGSTEIYTHTVGNVLLRLPGSVGQPGINASVCIEGAEAPETVGEVLVAATSPEAFRGYWNLPDLTRQYLSQDWYRTGDLGYQDTTGNFYVVGRTDEMIISGGEHIVPQVVESVLASHPNVLEVAVTGEPDNRWGHVVVAYVVPRTSGLRVFELDAYCKKQSALSIWARPRKYVFVRQIPKSATGKILRRELANLEGGL